MRGKPHHETLRGVLKDASQLRLSDNDQAAALACQLYFQHLDRIDRGLRLAHEWQHHLDVVDREDKPRDYDPAEHRRHMRRLARRVYVLTGLPPRAALEAVDKDLRTWEEEEENR